MFCSSIQRRKKMWVFAVKKRMKINNYLKKKKKKKKKKKVDFLGRNSESNGFYLFSNETIKTGNTITPLDRARGCISFMRGFSESNDFYLYFTEPIVDTMTRVIRASFLQENTIFPKCQHH